MAVNISGSFVDDTNPMTGDVETVPHIGIQGPPGPQGDPGGYYVPAIEQTGENELEVSFSPSLPDMPYVAPVKVTVTPDPDSGVDLTGYATEEYVQEYAQPKGNYLESTALPTAINTALSQAKESGAFDGAPGPTGPAGPQGPHGEPGQPGEPGKDGQDGKDYVLTDNDRAEIAEQAAGLVEIPEGDGKAFIVTITESGGKYTADKTPSEIYAAHNSGVPVLASLMAEDGIFIAYLIAVQYDAAAFQVPNFMLGEEQMGVTVIIAGNEPEDRSVSVVKTTGNADYELPIGGAELGGVKNGGNVVINEDGTMTAPKSSGGGIAVTGATPGQTVKIAEVDENGVPTAWEPVEFPSGGMSFSTAEDIMNLTTTERVNSVLHEYEDGKEPFYNLIIVRLSNIKGHADNSVSAEHFVRLYFKGHSGGPNYTNDPTQDLAHTINIPLFNNLKDNTTDMFYRYAILFTPTSCVVWGGRTSHGQVNYQFTEKVTPPFMYINTDYSGGLKAVKYAINSTTTAEVGAKIEIIGYK